MVDLTRDANGQVRARLARPGARPVRAGLRRLARRPTSQPSGSRIKHAALDPFRGYANALRDSLPDAVQVLDAFHVVKLGTQVVDEVRRRVQQQQLHRRGHKDDPLYKIRGLLRHGLEHLTERQHRKLQICLAARRPARRGRAGLGLLPAAPGRSTAGTASVRERRPSPRRSSPASRAARSPRSPGSAAPCGPGARRSSPTSPPTG